MITIAAAAQTHPAEEHWRRVRHGITAAGSVYVPLDSWVYPAFERLAARGFIDLAYVGLRPWTRLTCVNLLAAAEELFEGDSDDRAPRSVYQALRKEFAADYRSAAAETPLPHAELDLLYNRSLGIAGKPLNDSFHFGQTLTNDYGRPYQEGYSQISGFEARAESGRFTVFVRGEYQQAPHRSAYSPAVREAISAMDANPVIPPTTVPSVASFRLIDANVAVNVSKHELSIGKTDMWWGPGMGGTFAFSNNPEPIYAFRINRVEPLQIPILSRVLGPVRYDLFVGSLKGHATPLGPWIQGQKVAFKPSPNFEFGLARTIVFAGKGHVPLTVGSFWNSFTSFSNVSEAVKFSRNDPGARYSTFDFSYRLPFVRDWVTIYADSMVHDDVSPLSAPRRAAFRPGLYVSHFPGLAALDFRAEAVYTDFPTSRSEGGKFFFFEAAYHDAYTNKQFILGDWIGREGKGGQAWLTYHLSPMEQLQFSYRHAKGASDFVPGGTTQNDIATNYTHRIKDSFEVEALAQLEFWKAPILAAGLQKNLAISLQLTYFPKLSWARK